MRLFKSSECGPPALALLVIPAIATFAEASTVAVPTPPLTGLIISETMIDFGTIASTQPASRTVSIKNESQNTISIAYHRISCGCLAVRPEKWGIAPGESVNLTLDFDPAGYFGNVRQSAELRFHNEMGEESIAAFSVSANIQNPIALSPPYIAYQGIDMKAGNPDRYYKSDPILLAQTAVTGALGTLSPIVSIPEEYSQSFTAALDKKGDSGYALEAYFFPGQLLAGSHDRKGGFNIKIYTDETKSQFVNLPVSWHIEPNFSVTPESPLFIDNEPMDAEHLKIESVDGSPFEITEITFYGKTLGKDKIEGSANRNSYQLKLSSMAALIDQSSGAAQADLTIGTDRKDEPAVKVPVRALFTRRDE